MRTFTVAVAAFQTRRMANRVSILSWESDVARPVQYRSSTPGA